jgi:serine/threonine protein phosphatase PrpC
VTTLEADSETHCRMRAGAASHVGYFRENNEDCIHLDPEYPFALVLDGMGGLAAGELASRNGADAVAEALREGLAAGDEPPALIEKALQAGHDAVLDLGRKNRAFRHAGTTAVLTLLHRDRVYVSWLGDSPAYLISGGRIQKLTWDHNLTSVLVRHRIIREEDVGSHRIKNVLCRYLGSQDTKEPLEIPSFTPKRGDRLILATDGVSGVVPEAELLQLCREHPEPQACAEELVNRALENGSRDNCTCAVLAFDCEGPEPEPDSTSQVGSRKWWQFWK